MSLEFCFLEDHPHEIGEFIDLKRNYERYIAAILNSSFVESWRIQPHGFAFSWFLDQICFRVTRNRLTNGAIAYRRQQTIMIKMWRRYPIEVIMPRAVFVNKFFTPNKLRRNMIGICCLQTSTFPDPLKNLHEFT